MASGCGWSAGRRVALIAAAGLPVAAACGGFDPPDCATNEAVVELSDAREAFRGEVIAYVSGPSSVLFRFRDLTAWFGLEEPLSPGGSVRVHASLEYESGLGWESCSDPPDYGGRLYADDDGQGYTFEVTDLGTEDLLGCWNKHEMIGCARFVDADGDGVTDSFDVCPGEAEDHDGVEDDDGCDDPDDAPP